ncbi:MAG: hypothetical protein ACPG5W_09530 [Flavobacteriales bacterium]
MKQDQFYNWVQNPSSLDEASIPQLRELLKQYPYYQVGQAMLAKALKDANHIDQLNQLQLAAVMVPDRKQFHDYLHNKVKPAVKLVEPAQEVAVEPPVLEQPLIEEEAENRFPDELIPEPIIYQLETAVPTPIEIPELEIEIEEEAEEQVAEPSELSFSQWLDYSDSDKQETKPKLKKRKPKPAQSNIELIDHFLTQQTDAPKKRAEFFNPQKVAAKSQEEDFTVVTETLAIIYAQQEKYELATQAYEALSLKYPEKSVYFAARLKELAEKQNTED